MNLKSKVRNYGFWISIISAVLIIVQALGFNVNIPVIKEILVAVCGVFVALGIISDSDKGRGYID